MTMLATRASNGTSDRYRFREDVFQDTRALVAAGRRTESTSASMWFGPATKPLLDQFQEYVKDWKANRPRGADVEDMVRHPSYRHIVGMGRDVLPYLLEELTRQPDHWFPALFEITGENPVPAVSEGRIREMADAWIRWGRARKY